MSVNFLVDKRKHLFSAYHKQEIVPLKQKLLLKTVTLDNFSERKNTIREDDEGNSAKHSIYV